MLEWCYLPRLPSPCGTLSTHAYCIFAQLALSHQVIKCQLPASASLWRRPRAGKWLLKLVMLPGQVTLLFYYVLGVRLGQERYLRVNAVGYSAVLFGWCGLTHALARVGLEMQGQAAPRLMVVESACNL